MTLRSQYQTSSEELRVDGALLLGLQDVGGIANFIGIFPLDGHL